MGARGPKPKSAASKGRSGNAGRRPMDDHEPKVPAVELKPPRGLSADAKKEWKRVAPLLREAMVTSEMDRAMLESYVRAYEKWLEACRESDGHDGILISAKTQQPYLGPYEIREIMWNKQMCSCAAELGLSPLSRPRIRALEAESAVDDDDLFNQSGLRVVAG